MGYIFVIMNNDAERIGGYFLFLDKIYLFIFSLTVIGNEIILWRRQLMDRINRSINY